MNKRAMKIPRLGLKQVREVAEIGPDHLLVWLGLHAMADAMGSPFPVGTPEAQLIGMSKEKVHRHIRELAAQGFVHRSDTHHMEVTPQ
jgi:DNA-binding MarR family transcriptional regulator